MAKLSTEIIIYNVAGLINSAIPFFLLPYFSNFMSAADIGLFSLILTVLGFFTIMIGFNTHYPISIYFFKLKPEEYIRIISSGIFISFILFIIIVLIFVISGKQISFYFKIELWLLFSLAFLSLLQSIVNITFALIQIQGKPILFNGILISSTIINTIVSLILVINFEMSWSGRLIGLVFSILVSLIISACILYIFYKKNCTSNFYCFLPNIQSINISFKSSSSLLIFSLSGIILTFSDRFIILYFTNLSELGIYTMAYNFGMIASIFATTINRAWFPFLCKSLSEEKLISNNSFFYLILIIILILILTIVVILTVPYIFKFFISNDFSGSVELVPWIACAYALEGVATIISGAYLYNNKGNVLSIITLITAVFNILATLLLVKIDGVLGAAKATFLSYFLFLTLIFILSPKFINFKKINISRT